MGHGISHGKLHVATQTSKAKKALQYPTTVLKLPSLLRLCNVYRRFVLNFAKLALPLNKKLEKGEALQFNLDREDESSECLEE